MMAEADMLHEHDNVELIDGQLIPMSPINRPHYTCVNRMTRHFILLMEAINTDVTVSVQNPLHIDAHNVPEPDLALLRGADAEAAARDALLVVEVSDTTLDYDRDTKLPLYAEADIPEVWIVNLDARQVEVYRDPKGSDYTLRLLRDASTSVDIAALPDIDPLAVSDLFPPEDTADTSPERTTA